MSEYQWIVYSDGDVEFFDSEADAVAHVHAVIEDFSGDEWDDEVENIRVARVTHVTRKANVVTREMLSTEGEYNGQFYSGNADYWCDYELTPLVP